MRNIAGEPARVMDRHGLRGVPGVVDDLHLARFDDMEFQVALADREQCLPVPVGYHRGLETPAQFGDLGLVERRESNRLKIMFRHSWLLCACCDRLPVSGQNSGGASADVG